MTDGTEWRERRRRKAPAVHRVDARERGYAHPLDVGGPRVPLAVRSPRGVVRSIRDAAHCDPGATAADEHAARPPHVTRHQPGSPPPEPGAYGRSLRASGRELMAALKYVGSLVWRGARYTDRKSGV